jgi:hypothetical protein
MHPRVTQEQSAGTGAGDRQLACHTHGTGAGEMRYGEAAAAAADEDGVTVARDSGRAIPSSRVKGGLWLAARRLLKILSAIYCVRKQVMEMRSMTQEASNRHGTGQEFVGGCAGEQAISTCTVAWTLTITTTTGPFGSAVRHSFIHSFIPSPSSCSDVSRGNRTGRTPKAWKYAWALTCRGECY